MVQLTQLNKLLVPNLLLHSLQLMICRRNFLKQFWMKRMFVQMSSQVIIQSYILILKFRVDKVLIDLLYTYQLFYLENFFFFFIFNLYTFSLLFFFHSFFPTFYFLSAFSCLSFFLSILNSSVDIVYRFVSLIIY